MTILKCKDCEYARNLKIENPILCTNKAEAEYYKPYSDFLLNYISVNEEELEKIERCIISCYKLVEMLPYSQCAYNCYDNINKRVIESEPKITNFINTRISENNNEEDKKPSALQNFELLSICSVISLTLTAFVIIS
jgi:hypothetical protein